MKHKIEIIFHTGYGKTATTSLQKILSEIAESNEILYLGKCNEGKFINPEFEKIYYQLFRNTYLYFFLELSILVP